MNEQNMTGYPSIDKPWLKYYSEEALNAALPEGSMYEYLWESNKDHLDDIAIVYFRKHITYRKLFQKIDQCAKSLTALNIKDGDTVTVQALTIPQTVVLLYAISKVGAIANLIYITDTAQSVNQALIHTESKLYFVLEEVIEQISAALDGTEVENVVLLSLGTEMDFCTRVAYKIFCKKRRLSYEGNIWTWKQFMHLTPCYCEEVLSDGSRPVAMVHTGGTTGTPKSVVLTNHSINAIAAQYQKAEMGFCRQCTFLDVLPPFIAFGLTVSLHLPLLIGCRTILAPGASIEDTAKIFLKRKPNYYVAGPAQIEAILSQPQVEKLDFSFLRLLAIGGDALSAAKEQQISDFLCTHHSKAFVLQGYGMSELSATVCTEKPGAIKAGTVGIPLPDVNVKIINRESGLEFGYGEEGEICIMSPSVMVEYYKDKVETDAVLKTHKDGKLWLHTGDIGSLDTDGFLTITGRIKRIIYVSENAVFYKVFPKQIESQFEKMPEIRSIAIVGSSTLPESCHLVAFVVINGRDSLKTQELNDFAHEMFKSYEQPLEYRFMDELPRTKLGKVDYRALERMAAEGKQQP